MGHWTLSYAEVPVLYLDVLVANCRRNAKRTDDLERELGHDVACEAEVGHSDEEVSGLVADDDGPSLLDVVDSEGCADVEEVQLGAFDLCLVEEDTSVGDCRNSTGVVCGV